MAGEMQVLRNRFYTTYIYCTYVMMMYNRVQGRMAFLVSHWKKNSSMLTLKASGEIENWYFTLRFLP
jgi:hypothetical protein